MKLKTQLTIRWQYREGEWYLFVKETSPKKSKDISVLEMVQSVVEHGRGYIKGVVEENETKFHFEIRVFKNAVIKTVNNFKTLAAAKQYLLELVVDAENEEVIGTHEA